jgi:ACS family tartrate transporter-like MFS transporter
MAIDDPQAMALSGIAPALRGGAMAIRNRISLRLVAPLTFLTFLNSLDRVNVSFAALQMNADLGLDPQTYGFGVGIFFFSYLLFQFPHTFVLRRIGPRRWLFAAVLFWGTVATCMAFIQNATQFHALRFLLGVAESGFAPGIIYYMSQWMPRRFRAWAIAGSMLAIPISVVVGGPLSGWLMTLHNPLGLPGWRWMFLVEGLPTVAAAFVALRYFVDSPAQASWLNREQQAWLAAELERDRASASEGQGPIAFGQLLQSVRVWASAGVWFSLMCGAYGIIFWLPMMIKQMSAASDFDVGVLSALPWVAVGAGMLVNAWHSDRTQERYFHIGMPALLAAAGLLLSASIEPGWAALGWLVVAGFGLGSAQGAFWALPTSFLGSSAGTGITLINIVGSSGGLIAPPVIGWIRAQTGSFSAAIYALAGVLIAGALLLLVVRRSNGTPRSARDSDFDPISEQTLRDPHAAYAELRRGCPLAHGERWGGFWVLSRYEDIVAVTRDHETFVNSVQNVVPAVVTTGRRPPLHFDPPEHTMWRKALSGPFKASTVAALEPRVRALTVELLSPLIARGRAELATELAGSLPVLVLCAFLNAPAKDAPDRIRQLSDRFLRAFHARDHAALERESRNLYAIAAELLELRRREPLDPQHDVASALLAMRIDGEPVSDDLMQGALRQLLVAGHVAVTMAIGSAARHLAMHPELQTQLRGDRATIAQAVEELLRLYTPNQAFCRTAVRPVELHGQVVPAREPIVVLYPSANRDEDVFEAPDEFRLERSIKHVAFGNGVHKCPGEALARLQLRVFVEELLARTTRFELDGAVEFAQWPEYGPKSLPVRFVPA